MENIADLLDKKKILSQYCLSIFSFLVFRMLKLSGSLQCNILHVETRFVLNSYWEFHVAFENCIINIIISLLWMMYAKYLQVFMLLTATEIISLRIFMCLFLVVGYVSLYLIEKSYYTPLKLSFEKHYTVLYPP